MRQVIAPRAQVIADTVDRWTGVRIVTIEGDIPTPLLAQLNKHRAFSGSAQSARAVPLRKARDLPRWEPDWFGVEGKRRARGMDKGDPIPAPLARRLTALWREAEAAAWRSHEAIAREAQLAGWALSKGELNRLLAPFTMTRVVLTALDDAEGWGWLFLQRVDQATGGAQDAMRAFAAACRAALNASEPQVGDWHIPYDPGHWHDLPYRINVSAGTCAGASFRALPTPEKAAETAGGLQRDGHWVPFEHQAFTADAFSRRHPRRRPIGADLDGLRGNLWRPRRVTSWLQVRKCLDSHADPADPWRARAASWIKGPRTPPTS